MPAGDLEQFADKAGRGPVGHRDMTAGPADSTEFACGDVRPGCKHGAEHADDKVKRADSIWQGFSVTFLECDIYLLSGCARASLVEQVGRDVDSDDDRARLRCGNG